MGELQQARAQALRAHEIAPCPASHENYIEVLSGLAFHAAEALDGDCLFEVWCELVRNSAKDQAAAIAVFAHEAFASSSTLIDRMLGSYRQMELHDQVLILCTRYIETDAEVAHVPYMHRAASHWARGEMEAAWTDYVAALERQPQLLPLWDAMLALAGEKEDRFALLSRLSARMMEQYGETPGWICAQAHLLFAAHRREPATACFERLLAHRAFAPYAHHRLSQLAYLRGDQQAALRHQLAAATPHTLAATDRQLNPGIVIQGNVMGITYALLEKLRTRGVFGDGGARVLDIGSSNLYLAKPGQVTDFVGRFSTGVQGSDLAGFAERLAKGSAYDPIKGGINQAYVGELIERCGMQYLAFDIFQGYGTEILDLNVAALPEKYRGHFDAVINSGTTEHVLNQYNSFKTIHEATRVGGCMVHALPASGFTDHGYFTYTGRMFFDLASYNGYEIVDFYYDGPAGTDDLYQSTRSYAKSIEHLNKALEQLKPAGIPNYSLVVILRKVHDAPFKACLETSTTVGPVTDDVRTAYTAASTAADEDDHQRAAQEYHLRTGNADMDPAFLPLYEECRRYSMTSADRMFALYKAVHYLEQAGIGGSFVECGVWRGGSMMLAARTLLEIGNATRDLYLFDTFEGLPEPDEKEDIDVWGNRAIDGWRPHAKDERSSSWALATLDEVRANLARVSYPSERVHYVKGLVEETIPKQAPDKIALLRLDTDWYASTRHELEHLFPRLVPHGVLIIDDYGHLKGARKAVDEYIAQQRLPLMLMRVDYTGRVAVKNFS
jgi:tetratricopeptide (TPR) repeat protein